MPESNKVFPCFNCEMQTTHVFVRTYERTSQHEKLNPRTYDVYKCLLCGKLLTVRRETSKPQKFVFR